MVQSNRRRAQSIRKKNLTRIIVQLPKGKKSSGANRFIRLNIIVIAP
jgi:hypothetical protein